jgi:hypothetical protein
MVMEDEVMAVEIIVEWMAMIKAKKSPLQSGERDQSSTIFDGDGALVREMLCAP